MRHLVYDTIDEFCETDPPSYYITFENKWWYDKYVMSLEYGDSVITDWHEITRIE